MLSFTEENYLKALVQLTLFRDEIEVGVNTLALELTVKPATVSDMVKKLKEKSLVHYEKYGKISLTEEGRLSGLLVIRRHRLWETFLHDKLGFTWDEVHEVAEELEHIQSSRLVNSLDKFLDNPKVDPHGDPIPDKDGNIEFLQYEVLSDIEKGNMVLVRVVKDNSAEFLQYAQKTGIVLNEQINVLEVEPFDGMMTIRVNNETKVVSKKVTDSILVEILN